MLYYVTGNKNKINTAKLYLKEFGIEIEGRKLDLAEEQSDSVEKVALSKATQAFEILKSPLIVSDAGWFIESLRGFPGLFMKYINQWLKSEDFLKLMRGKTDRTIMLKEGLCFIDKNGSKVFMQEVKGKILEKPYGSGLPSDQIISLSNSGMSIAEAREKGIKSADDQPVWREFAKWYKNQV